MVALLVRSLRTGESSARERLAERLRPDVELVTDDGRFVGASEVIARLSQQWAFTPVLARAHWTQHSFAGDVASVEATCPGLGAAPSHVDVTVEFDDQDLIRRVQWAMTLWDPPTTGDALPPHVRAAIDGALANGTPMTLAYVGLTGEPSLSLRGSVQCAGPLELTMWIRKRQGFVDAIAREPRVSLLYRNSPTRTTLTIVGAAREVDGRRRQQIYELSPEVEQLHDPGRTGIAVVIDIDRITGTSPFGMVLVEREPE